MIISNSVLLAASFVGLILSAIFWKIEHPNYFRKKRIQLKSAFKNLIMAALLLLSCSNSKVFATATAYLEQTRNGSATSPVSPMNWERGNVNATQAPFVEAYSLAYRMTITGL